MYSHHFLDNVGPDVFHPKSAAMPPSPSTMLLLLLLQPLALTKEQIAANEADIRSLCEKVGQDPAMLLASMPKTYTAATPTLFS